MLRSRVSTEDLIYSITFMFYDWNIYMEINLCVMRFRMCAEDF